MNGSWNIMRWVDSARGGSIVVSHGVGMTGACFIYRTATSEAFMARHGGVLRGFLVREVPALSRERRG